MKIYCVSAGSDSTAVTEWRPNIHPTIHYLFLMMMIMVDNVVDGDDNGVDYDDDNTDYGLINCNSNCPPKTVCE